MPVFSKRVASVLIATCALGGAAAAQPVPSGNPPEHHGGFDPEQARARFEARRAERTRALHDVLGIQPSQEAAFSAFTASMHPARRSDDGPRGEDREAQASAMTTPQRLDAMKARMDARIADMRQRFERRSAATKALYAALDARQQRVMDALPELEGRGGGRWGHGRMDRAPS